MVKYICTIIILVFSISFKSNAQLKPVKTRLYTEFEYRVDGKNISQSDAMNIVSDRTNNIGKPDTLNFVIDTANIEVSKASKSSENVYKTKNIFFLVIDGLRDDEGFDAGNIFLNHIWTTLKPQGTTLTRFYNNGITHTTAAHYGILSGNYQNLLNNTQVKQLLRPVEPTLFEYYRKYNNIPMEKAIFISGKNSISRYPVGYNPSFGVKYQPLIALTHHDDRYTYDSAIKLIDMYKPSLCYVLFAQVDAYGHTNDQSSYYGSILQADYLVSEMVKKIQSDSFYKDNTTIIITSDHGRHDKDHGDWKEHGDNCHGCRDVFFLAIGPDFMKNYEVNEPYDFVDILPTVSNLIQIKTPFAYGDIMKEMFANFKEDKLPKEVSKQNGEINLSKKFGHSLMPSLTIQNNKVNVVFSSEDKKQFNLFFTSSVIGKSKWSRPKMMATDSLREFYNPIIKAINDTILIAAFSSTRYIRKTDTYNWETGILRSINSGKTWDIPNFIDEPETFSCRPALTSFKNSVYIVSQKTTKLIYNFSSDYGMNFQPFITIFDSFEPKKIDYPQNLDAFTIGHSLYTTWQNITPRMKKWSLWFDNTPGDNKAKVIHANKENDYSFISRAAVGKGNVIHLVFNNLDNAPKNNDWRVLYIQSKDSGVKWTDTVCISVNEVAYKPRINVNEAGRIIVTWESYNKTNDKWCIKATYSDDTGVNWNKPEALTSEQELIQNHEVEILGDKIFLVWQDYRNGKSSVFYKMAKLKK